MIGGSGLGLGADWWRGLIGGGGGVSAVGESWLDALFTCTMFEGGSAENLE